MLFGLGGILAEAVDDVAMAIAPLARSEASRLVESLRARKLLDAFRGEQPVDRDALVKVLLGLSRMAIEHPEICEVDINPLRITAEGKIFAVDALVALREPDPPPAVLPPVSPQAIGQLFYPRSIAFVGASAQMGKWGFMLPVNTIGGGYTGKVYLVNPKGGTMNGQPVFAGLEDIPDPVDLVVVTIPAHRILPLIAQCRRKHVKSMILISSGFSETGSKGRQIEAELVAAARDAGILILGPNTMGIANPHASLYCTGSSVNPMPGTTAMVSQSGNMGTQLLAFAESQEIGIRGFCGSGNEAMITIEDFLEGFEVDELTRTVILYVESIKNGLRFFQSAKRVSRHKPVVLLKGGQTTAGNRAAASHTGALASDSRVFNAMCRQAGVIKVERPMELLDLAAAFSSLPLPRGPRVAIMTLGGGWGVVTADLCMHHRLQVPVLDPAIIRTLDALLPDFWSRANPVDLVGEQDSELPLKTLEALMSWDGCDAVIDLGILGRRIFLDRLAATAQKIDPGLTAAYFEGLRQMLNEFDDRFIKKIVALMHRYQKPIIGVHLLTDGQDKTLYRVDAADYQAVFYETPERAVYALSQMVQYQNYLSRDPE